MELTDKPTWVVDAVDGSKNLAGGRPEVAVSVALYKKRAPEFGIIYLPYRRMTVKIAKGENLLVNEVEWTRRRPTPDQLKGAIVALPGDMARLRKKPTTHDLQRIMSELISEALAIRVTGALAYDLACLALGEIDARISTSAQLVDAAAGVLLVRETHGVVTDLDGNPWIPQVSKDMLAAASTALHAQILSLIKAAKVSNQQLGASSLGCPARSPHSHERSGDGRPSPAAWEERG